MSLHITDTAITSDEVDETAHCDDDARWHVTNWPARTFGRDQAISAMTLTEELARPAPNRLFVESLRSELE
jgi:hypothetical protein